MEVDRQVVREVNTLSVYLEDMGNNICLNMGQGFTAAVIYLGIKLCGVRSYRTQREISDTCGITEVTLRNNYNIILTNLGITKSDVESIRYAIDDIVSGAYRNES